MSLPFNLLLSKNLNKIFNRTIKKKEVRHHLPFWSQTWVTTYVHLDRNKYYTYDGEILLINDV